MLRKLIRDCPRFSCFTLKLYFALTTAMTPVPYLLVEIERGADPALVRQARDAIHLNAGCPPSPAWERR
jgi:hypothetical protein